MINDGSYLDLLKENTLKSDMKDILGNDFDELLESISLMDDSLILQESILQEDSLSMIKSKVKKFIISDGKIKEEYNRIKNNPKVRAIESKLKKMSKGTVEEQIEIIEEYRNNKFAGWILLMIGILGSIATHNLPILIIAATVGLYHIFENMPAEVLIKKSKEKGLDKKLEDILIEIKKAKSSSILVALTDIGIKSSGLITIIMAMSLVIVGTSATSASIGILVTILFMLIKSLVVISKTKNLYK